MKALKLDHDLAQQVLAGQKTSTWRLFDDKDITVNDAVRLIDKVDDERPETWQNIGIAHITRVIEKPLAALNPDDSQGHRPYASLDDVICHFQKYYGDAVTPATTVKIIHFNLEADMSATDDRQVRQLDIYTDGGSRGNPGPSAAGFILIDSETGKVIVDEGRYIGVTTNSQAEYLALKYALEAAVRMGARTITINMDSLMVINQMKGSFKLRNRDLWPVHDAIKRLLEHFEAVHFQHIPREQNGLADAAVNRALDEHQDTDAIR